MISLSTSMNALNSLRTSNDKNCVESRGHVTVKVHVIVEVDAIRVACQSFQSEV